MSRQTVSTMRLVKLRSLLPSRRLLFIIGLVGLAGVIAAYGTLSVFFPDTMDGIKRVAERNLTRLQGGYYDLFTNADDFSIEDPAERFALPEYKIVPALAPDLRTPHIPYEEPAADLWLRSTANDAAQRFSALSSISPENVADLELAWTFCR